MSLNFVDYVCARETHVHKVQMIPENCSRLLLARNILREYSISQNNMNKVLCSQWVSDRQVVFGTECNKLMIYDVVTQKLKEISLPHVKRFNLYGDIIPDWEDGIYYIEVNPSRTLLSTGSKNCASDIVIYRLPTMDLFCLGMGGHDFQVLETCWLNDEFLVSVSKDNKLALWHVNNEITDSSGTVCVIYPIEVKECIFANEVRALAFNKVCNEIAVVTRNRILYIWSAKLFEQKVAVKLPIAYCFSRKVCIAVQDNGNYVVACDNNIHFLDARTLQKIEEIPNLLPNSFTSVSFQGSILTLGTVGMLKFYDVRAQKYLEFSTNAKITIALNVSRGYVIQNRRSGQYIKYAPAVWTHCYNAVGSKLFTAGGPLHSKQYGNYAGIWQ